MKYSEPSCHGIIFSDSVIREEGTGKLSMIGTFTQYNLPRLPCQVPHFFVTILLTGLNPKDSPLDVTVRIEQNKSGAVLQSVTGQINIKKGANYSNTDIIELPMLLKPFTVPEHSDGQKPIKVVLLVNNEEIASRNIKVNKVVKPGGPATAGR